MAEDTIALTIASGLASFVQIALLVAFLVVVVVPVRRNRPDAWLALLGAAIVQLAGTILHRVLNILGPMMGLRHMASFYAGTALLGTCISTVFWVLLLVGLMKIAKPPHLDVAGAPPYR
jgi:formate hydrogenlyase subunit 4